MNEPHPTDDDDVLDSPRAPDREPPYRSSLEEVLERLDLLDDLDSLQGGGTGGLATGVELFGEQLAHGPMDHLLDAFEPVRDLADHTDVFDDLF